MLEENFQDIDRDFLTVVSRYYLRPNRKNQMKLVELAENGQFNAALICLKDWFKFDKLSFYVNFVEKFGRNDKYIKLIYMFEQYTINKKMLNDLEKRIEKLCQKNWPLGTYAFPLLWMRDGSVKCIDQGLIFTPFNLLEKIRLNAYSEIRELRKQFLDSKYYQLKSEATSMFLKEFLDDKPQFAGILNMLDKCNNTIILEPDISENVEELIYYDYVRHKNDEVYAYNYADMVMSILGTKHTQLCKKTFIDYTALETAHQIFYNLHNRDLLTINDTREK